MYIKAINSEDSASLLWLGGLKDPNVDEAALRHGVADRIDTYGDRSVRLESQSIQSPVPRKATAHLSGTMAAHSGTDDGGTMPYNERLFLNHGDDRWYVELARPPSTPSPGQLPTAGVSPAP